VPLGLQLRQLWRPRWWLQRQQQLEFKWQGGTWLDCSRRRLPLQVLLGSSSSMGILLVCVAAWARGQLVSRPASANADRSGGRAVMRWIKARRQCVCGVLRCMCALDRLWLQWCDGLCHLNGPLLVCAFGIREKQYEKQYLGLQALTSYVLITMSRLLTHYYS
jgi:hypothetical protein